MKSRKTYGQRWTPNPTEQRRWRLRAALIGLLTVEDFEMATAQAMTLREVFALARTRAREQQLVCEKCGESIVAETAETVIADAEDPQPFTP